jgi:hypothetical protein
MFASVLRCYYYIANATQISGHSLAFNVSAFIDEWTFTATHFY